MSGKSAAVTDRRHNKNRDAIGHQRVAGGKRDGACSRNLAGRIGSDAVGDQRNGIEPDELRIADVECVSIKRRR